MPNQNDVDRLKQLVSGGTEQGLDDATRLQQLVSQVPVGSQSELNLQSSGVQQGFKGDSQYDQGLSFGSNQSDLRANNQPLLHEIGNGLITAVANVIPQTLGNFAAIADVGDYLNQDAEVGNAITRAMMEWQKSNPLGLGTEDLPIYQKENSDMGNQEWWTTAGRDLVTSIGAFVGTGAALGGALGATLNGMGTYGKVAATVLTAVGLNQAEGIQSAIGVYDTTYKTKFEEYEKQGLEDADELAQKDAASAASLTVNLNRLTIPLNLTSTFAFMRTPAVTRALVEQPGFKSGIRSILGEGVQEAAEEEINLVAEKAGMARGAGKDYGVGDAINNIFSAEGFASGLLGAIGGAGQTVGTIGVNRVNGNYSAESERYNQQQQSISEIDGILNSNNIPSVSSIFKSAKEQIQLNNDLQEAMDNGDPSAASIGQAIISSQAYNAFTIGTTEKLLDTYKKIGQMSSEEAAAKGLNVDTRSPEHYVRKSQEATQQIERMEKIYNKINPALPNAQLIFHTQVQRMQYNKQLSELNKEISEAFTELQQEKANRGIEDGLENTNPVTQKLQSYKEYTALVEQRAMLQQQAIDLDNRLEYIQSPQYFADKEAKKAAEQVISEKAAKISELAPEDKQALSETLSAEAKIEASEFIAKDHQSPEEIGEDVGILSDENQNNPLISQVAQVKSDELLRQKTVLDVTNDVTNRTPEIINDGTQELLATPITPEEGKIMGTTHSHVIIEGRKIKFISDIAHTEAAPQEITLPQEPETFLDYIGVREEPLAKIADSKPLDLTFNRIGTTVQQFELTDSVDKKGRKTKKVKLGKDGNPIEKQGLQTPNNIPFDFKTLNSPQFTEKTPVFLSHAETSYGGKTYDTIFVNVKNENGELVPVTQMQEGGYGEIATQIIEKVKNSAKPIQTTIENKFTDSSNRVGTENNSSLRDLQLNASQHLPYGQLFIGQMYGKNPVVSKIGEFQIPEFKATGVPDGRSFVLVTDPTGRIYGEMLFQNKSKDVEIGGKKASALVMTSIEQFIVDNDIENVDWDKKGLKQLKSQFEDVKDQIAGIIDIGRRPYNTFNLGFDVNPESKNVELYLNMKGQKTFDRATIIKAIGERPMAIKAEALQQNAPISINGVEFPTYVDFLVNTNAVQTNLYTKQPFRDARIKLDIVQILGEGYQENQKKVELANKYGNAAFRLNKNNLDPSKYKVWDREQEIAWIQNNLPNTPVNVLANTIDLYERFGQKAFGAFQNGIIYLANNTEAGTSYHESFHAVFNTYLSEADRKSILAEGRTEEELAEDFRAYMLTEGRISPKGKVATFFQEIYHWITDLVGLNKINNLFYNINAGKFADKLPSFPNQGQFRLLNLDSAGLNQSEVQKDVVDSVLANVIRGGEKKLSEVKEFYSLLADGISDFRKGIFTSVVENFEEIKKLVNKQYETLDPFKAYLNTVPEEINSLGFHTPVDYDRLFPILSDLLKDAENAEEMVNILTVASEEEPVLIKIVEDLNKPNSTLKDLFYNTFSVLESSASKRLNRIKANTGGILDSLLINPYFANSRLLNLIKSGQGESIDFSIKDSTKASYASKFEDYKQGLFTPYVIGKSNPVWNIPTVSTVEFYDWMKSDIQAEYARITQEVKNLFTGKPADFKKMFFVNYPFLDSMLWVKKPSKITDVNLIDLADIDFNSPEFAAVLQDEMARQFKTEADKMRKEGFTAPEEELNNFIANQIYANVEITKLSLGDLTEVDKDYIVNYYIVPAEAQGEYTIETANHLSQAASKLQKQSETTYPTPNSQEKGYTIVSTGNGEVDTLLPLDFPTISDNSKAVLVGNPSDGVVVRDVSNSEIVEPSKYKGKKHFWSPTYQEFLLKQKVQGKYNVNTLTGNVFEQLGSDENALIFLNQPILKDLVDEYYKIGSLQLAVNKVAKDWKVNDEEIDVNDLGDFEPKQFVPEDLTASLKEQKDAKEVLKSFVYFYNISKPILDLPANSKFFSDYSPAFLDMHDKISNVFGTELTREDKELINSDLKLFLMTQQDSYFGKIENTEELAQADFSEFESLTPEELWITYSYSDAEGKQQILDYLKSNFVKNGFGGNIHTNFYVEVGSGEFFRNMKRTLDVSFDNKTSERFIDQFVRNNYKDLPYIFKGEPDATNRPTYLVSNNNLFKFVDNSYVLQDTSDLKQYNYNQDFSPVLAEVVNPKVDSLKQALIEEGVQVPYSATDEQVVFEWKKFCNNL